MASIKVWDATNGVWLKITAGGGTSAPAASETVAGIAELATAAEVAAGTDATRIVTPATLAERMSTVTGGRSLQVLIDFGTNQDTTTTTVAAAWVTAGSVIVCTPAAVATADHDAEDAAAEGLQSYPANLVPGVGFDIITIAPNGSWGRYYINAISV
jgi:hypothetical protein